MSRHLKSSLSLSRFCAILSCALLATTCLAEINGDESIDLIIADSDTVVRGRVIAVVRDTGKGSVIYETAKVKVTETLKGPKRDEIILLTRHTGRENIPSQWREEGVEMLFCVVKGERYKDNDKRYAESEWTVRYRWGRLSAFRLNDKPERGVFTTDFKVLTKADDIMKAARQAASASTRKKKLLEHRVDVPGATEAHKKLYAGSSVYLVVPVDERLEKQAKKWLKSTDFMLRYEGARALRHFKTDENIPLLKGLLSDPGYTVRTYSKTDRRRVYSVRKEAYEALTEWGVQIDKPVIEEPLTN